MGTFIKTLMDKAKANIIYPRTVASAVVRSDGVTTVETALANKPDKPSLLAEIPSWGGTDLILVENATGVKRISVANLVTSLAYPRIVYVGDANLNTLTNAGMYRVDVPTNAPWGFDYYSNVLVVIGATDTLTQIFYNRLTNHVFTRGATISGGNWIFREWDKQAKYSEIMSGNTTLQLVREYPILLFNTLVDINSNAYGYGFNNFGTLGAGITYLFEFVCSITQAGFDAGYNLMFIAYNASWTWSASVSSYHTVEQKVYFEFTPLVTEVIYMGFWYMPAGGSRIGSSYVRFWRLWKKY